MTPCRPQSELLICPTCMRLNRGLPHLAECRPSTVAIDATTLSKGGRCAFHVQRETPVMWWNKETEAA